MDPFAKQGLKPQFYQSLRFGQIKPGGWMRAQMLRDLEHGFLGHLDELVPDLIQKDDIYGANRLTKNVSAKDLGVVSVEKIWEVQFLWWNSETQSNWRDGLVRTTLLLEHPFYLPKIRAYVQEILDTQDEDGYLGIYAPDLRYNFSGENGELWAQASLLRVLLGYYEASGEDRVLTAVQRAVDVTMHSYPMAGSAPFTLTNDFAGVCHGLMFTDVFDRLYQLTGQTGYLDYALWLYQEYSKNTLSQADVQVGHLLDPEYRFRAHGVHTYEQLRALLTALYASDNSLLAQALAAYLDKLQLCLTPSGGPIGAEWIEGKQANASETGYEYCSIHELLDSYSNLLQKTGDPGWADRIEWLLFNAGQGARHPSEGEGGYPEGIAYLKTDNSFSMMGCMLPGDPVDEQNLQTRYKYSNAHQDVAVCCVPNAGRIYPYYIKSMWLRSAGGLTAALYGDCQLDTEVNDAAVRIRETTDYPFDLQLTFTIEVDQPVEFEISFRKPGWSTGFQIEGTGDYYESNGLIVFRVTKNWRNGDAIRLCFVADVKINSFGRSESFPSYGALLFALPLEAEARAGREYPLEGFQDLYYYPAGRTGLDLRLDSAQPFKLEQNPFNPEHPWDGLTLTGSLFDLETQKLKPVTLIPFGGTILRRATFGSL
ncbi:MAG: glycoside hydrolase family 127 protein [Chloroflexi bacterium]|nr:glycoside hydrolase family 127 protein [Chloroflexota bacterium]